MRPPHLEYWAQLSGEAWKARENAFLIDDVKVGAAVLTPEGRIFTGCNVEHRYRCHDVHAEVNAITTMVAAGLRVCKAILIVAERPRFTPCGGCLDWIYQFGGSGCRIGVQRRPGGPVEAWTAAELMPFYPE